MTAVDDLLILDDRLHQYQVKAVEHLWANPRAALFLDMGLGKTAAVLQALQPRHLPVLVVAPKRVTEKVWPTETAIWRPDLSIQVAAGTAAKRQAALRAGANITVISRDNLKDAEPGRYRTVVFDELSSFKNRTTQRWKFAKKLADATQHAWGLTGTPSPNGLMDLWAQVALLDGGRRLGRTLTTYRSRYFRPGRQLATGTIIEWNLLPGAQTDIERAIADICLSMRAVDHLDLPPVSYNTIEVALPPKALKTYDAMVKDLVARMDDTDFRSAANMAVAVGKLSQITAGFIYPDTDQHDQQIVDLHSAKIDAACEVVDGAGGPVLVFYRYTHERDLLRAALPQARTIDERGVIEAWNAQQVPVLLAHPASAGHGLNLQHGGHTVLWTTATWSFEERAQANARVARQGQTHPVVIHDLVVPGTVDQSVLDALGRKTGLQDALMGALRRA